MAEGKGQTKNIPKGFKRQAITARANIEDFRYELERGKQRLQSVETPRTRIMQRRTEAQKSTILKETKSRMRGNRSAIESERLRVKAASRGVKIDPAEAGEKITRSRRKGIRSTSTTSRIRSGYGRVPKATERYPSSVFTKSGIRRTMSRARRAVGDPEKYRPLRKMLSKVGGKALVIAEPTAVMTEATLKQQQRRRLGGLQSLTGQRFKEM